MARWGRTPPRSRMPTLRNAAPAPRRLAAALAALALLASTAPAAPLTALGGGEDDDAVALERGVRELGAREARARGVGGFVDEARCRTLDGAAATLGAHADERGLVVALVSTTCPVGRKQAPAVARAERRALALGYGFVHVGFEGLDDAASLRAHAEHHGLEAPVLIDAEGEVADALDARTTTEVFVIDARGTLRYRGAIDDQYGIGFALPEPRNRHLDRALKRVAMRLPAPPSTHAPGCALERDGGEVPGAVDDGAAGGRDVSRLARPTYARDVSRILQRNCVECHRDGGVAPFALETHRDVSRRASMILAVVEDGLMPPWFAAHEGPRSRWVGDRSLLAEEVDVLRRWVLAGKPEGDPSELPLPLPREASGWALGEPDAVYAMPRAFEVPAEGRVAYQYFAVPTGLEQDAWVRAIEVRPGAVDVVHHVLAYPLPEDAFVNGRLRRWDLVDERRGFFAAWAPGAEPVGYPDGHARRLPAGTVLLLELHYTPNGRPARDLSRIGVHFASEDPGYRPRHVVRTAGISDRGLVVPPGAEAHESGAMGIVGRDLRVRSFMPHMHLRGRSFRFEHVPLGSDRAEVLLDVPRYDFNWQLSYELAEPVTVRAGDRIDVHAVFDNSAGNLANPAPGDTVRWGPDTDDEMLIGFIDYVLVEEDLDAPPGRRDIAVVQPSAASWLRSVVDRAGGTLPRAAVPADSREGFDLLDLDGDGVLDGRELRFLSAGGADGGR